MTKPDAPKALATQGRETVITIFKNVQVEMEKLGNALTVATPEVVTEVFAQVKQWEGLVKDVGNVAKEMIKSMVLEKGKQTTDKGSRELVVAGYQLEVRPHRTGLDPAKVQALLKAKGLDFEVGMDADISWKVNEQKLALAVEIKKQLTEDEVVSCQYDESWSVQSPKKVSKA